MRVSESRGCLTASKGSKVCRPNIYTKQATPVPSESILEQAKLGQLRILPMFPMKEPNTIRIKSRQFAIRIVKFAQYLRNNKKELVISNQILRSGTSIGANIYESRNAQSKEDFVHKLSIALKEADETEYWLDVLFGSEIINKEEHDSLFGDLDELISLLTSIIKSSKTNK